MIQKLPPLMACCCVIVALASPTPAAEFILDFNTDPATLGAEFFGTSEWREEGGVDNSGYLKVTDNFNSEIGAIIFPDLENGEPVSAFSISADLRVGGGTAPPADGFSFNFVRPNDPLLDEDDEILAIDTTIGRGNGWAEIPPHPNLYLPEEGSQTGLAIMFDTYQNGPASPSADCNEINPDTDEQYDCIGIGVRIDNEIVAATNLPTINGAFDDDESLTTNVDDEYANNGIAPVFDLDEVHFGEGLTWARLEIEYSESGNLFVSYKGREIINQPVEYEPSPGFLVFGGRTGGANAYHHIDNITLRTNSDVSSGPSGDFNQDGMLDAADIDLLTAAVGGNDLSFDLDANGTVDDADRTVWVHDLKQTYFGDADMDGQFSSADLVTVLAAGAYEVDVDSGWAGGDFNGDARVNSADLVSALADGGYEQGPRGAAQSVPEPSGVVLLAMAIAGLASVRRWTWTR